MESHIDQLRIRSKMSLSAYVEGLKENSMVKSVNFIYLSNKVFDYVILGLLYKDGIYGVEIKDNIIGMEIDGIYCKLIKGMKWDKEFLEESILNGDISTINPNKDYVRLREVIYKT